MKRSLLLLLLVIPLALPYLPLESGLDRCAQNLTEIGEGNYRVCPNGGTYVVTGGTVVCFGRNHPETGAAHYPRYSAGKGLELHP